MPNCSWRGPFKIVELLLIGNAGIEALLAEPELPGGERHQWLDAVCHPLFLLPQQQVDGCEVFVAAGTARHHRGDDGGVAVELSALDPLGHGPVRRLDPLFKCLGRRFAIAPDVAQAPVADPELAIWFGFDDARATTRKR